MKDANPVRKGLAALKIWIVLALAAGGLAGRAQTTATLTIAADQPSAQISSIRLTQ